MALLFKTKIGRNSMNRLTKGERSILAQGKRLAFAN